MKKILFALVAIFTLGISNAAADNDKLINKSELPAKAQQFIDTYFANVKLTYAKMERDFLERTYEVVLADGKKETLILALRNDNKHKVWLLDGGL